MIAFQNRKFKIRVENVRLPNGVTVKFASLTKQPGTAIIPMVDKDTILINYQYRVPVRRWIYELPGGKVEKDETPIQNARKELEEELGYRAGKMRLVGKVYTSPHISDDLQYVFIATNLRKTERHLEKGEVIKLRRLKVRDAVRMVYNGRITAATTTIAILMLDRHGPQALSRK